MPIITDDIIDGLKKQDHITQVKFSTKYKQFLLRMCLDYTGNNYPDAMIMFNKGLYNIFNKIYQFRYKGSFEGWVVTIFKNLGRDYLKRKQTDRVKKGRITCFSDSFIDNEFQQPIEPNDYFTTYNGKMPDITEKEILDVIYSLATGYRKIFILYHLNGYKHKEIARSLGISVNTSKSQLHRGKKIIAKILKEKYNVTHNYV